MGTGEMGYPLTVGAVTIVPQAVILFVPAFHKPDTARSYCTRSTTNLYRDFN